MEFFRITDTANEYFAKAIQLYGQSFPFNEQREALSQKEIMSNDEYHFDVILQDEKFVGQAMYWETQDFVYLEHFCILQEERNKGIGQNVLKMLKEKNKIVILEIDPPCDEISVRRKIFYERNGFVTNDFNHIHPPYHNTCKGHSLVVMTYPAKITPKTYKNFNDYLVNTVMKNVF